jgi:hypothetical protein
MQQFYVLDDAGVPQQTSEQAFAEWVASADVGIARTVVSASVAVVTTFDGVAVADPAGGAPRLFETRVYGGVLDGEEARHGSRDEAMVGHSHLVAWCRVGESADYGVTADQLQ